MFSLLIHTSDSSFDSCSAFIVSFIIIFRVLILMCNWGFQLCHNPVRMCFIYLMDDMKKGKNSVLSGQNNMKKFLLNINRRYYRMSPVQM